MLLLTLALFDAPASAQQPQDVERVRTGQDIEAWRELDRDDADQLAEFITDWPSSNLSLLAAQRLNQMGEAVADLSKAEAARLDDQLADHAANLKATGRASVETLEVGSQGRVTVTETGARRFQPTVEVGGTGTMGVAGMYLHAGVGGEHLGVAVRGTAAQTGADVGFVARATWSPHQLSPYAEVIGAVRQPALGGAVGVRQPLDHGFALSLAVESMVWGVEPAPTVRFGAAKAF